MSSKSMLYKILAAIMVVTILGACNVNPAPTSVPTAVPTMAPTEVVPTENIAPTLDVVRTQAVQTAVVNMTLNAPTATPVTPTSTSTAAPAVTLTFTPVPPTALPTATSTATWVLWTSTPAAVNYGCSVADHSPNRFDTIKVNTNFTAKWVVTNIGNHTWGVHAVDIKYISGTKMQTQGDLFDLGSAVPQNASYTVAIYMKTPSTAGTYTAIWEIVQSTQLICTLNLSVNVSN